MHKRVCKGDHAWRVCIVLTIYVSEWTEDMAKITEGQLHVSSTSDNMVKVILQVAIIFAIVAEKLVTILAIPHCLMSLLFVIVAVVVLVTFVYSSYRKVYGAESLTG